MDPIFFEKVVLQLLYKNKKIRQKILPFLKSNIFTDFENKEIVKFILSYIDKYNKFPTVKDSKLHIDKKDVYVRVEEIINIDVSEYNEDSLFNKIEDFFKKKLVWNEVSNIVEELKDDNLNQTNNSPDKLRNALSFSFDTNIGLNLFKDSTRVYDFFHNKDKGISTGIKSFDKNIMGGIHKKTLTVLMGGTGIGKTLVKCSIAANMLMANKNILYITLEVSEENIAGRILQNLFNLTREEISQLNKGEFYNKYKELRNKIENNLYIKEYPTKSANTNTIRNLLVELENKKKFKPDVIFVDYLGIMLPISGNKSDNSYTEGKKIAEELRGLSVETDTPIMSSVQSNRDGLDSSELSLKNIADSIGTAQGADILIGIVQPEEYIENKKAILIFLKNRYGFAPKKISVNFDKEKMKISDDDSNKNITKQTTEKSKTGISEVKNVLSRNKKNRKNKIIDFK